MKIGVSQCLLGDKVRFSGEGKRDRFITDTLSQYATFMPICPEVAIGMGVPRPAIHLAGNPDYPQVVGVSDSSLNVTKPLNAYSKKIMPELKDLSGFILKAKSPTCGMARVKVFQKNKHAERNGIGVFARHLMETYPYLPVEEEGRLHDPVLKENFIERIFCYFHWKNLMLQGISKKSLVYFHTCHKLSLMAHNLAGYRRLGQIIANPNKQSASALAKEYLPEFMVTLKQKATPKKHTNVLHHIMGYFKKVISADDKQEALELIERYRLGQVPLIVPITLINHFQRKYPHDYLADQTYLNPHPDDLMLRNHI